VRKLRLDNNLLTKEAVEHVVGLTKHLYTCTLYGTPLLYYLGNQGLVQELKDHRKNKVNLSPNNRKHVGGSSRVTLVSQGFMKV
jgi:Icc-related predicted phosphoesterase